MVSISARAAGAPIIANRPRAKIALVRRYRGNPSGMAALGTGCMGKSNTRGVRLAMTGGGLDSNYGFRCQHLWKIKLMPQMFQINAAAARGVHPDLRRHSHCALAPVSLITFAHFSVSIAMMRPKAAGVSGVGGPPIAMNGSVT